MAQDPDAIQRDIERTRAQLAETVSTIADRVSPKNVADRTKARAQAQIDSVKNGDVQVKQERVAAVGGGSLLVLILLALRRRRRRRKLRELADLRRELRRRKRARKRGL